jgi:c-di-GMP-binding flagellar brake protein YcgR
MTTMPTAGDKIRSIIAGTTCVVKKIKDKMIVLETHNEKSLTKDEDRGEILLLNSVYRPQKEYFKDRRKYPRVHMDLPLEYRVKYDAHAHGAIAVDASEGGFLIYSIEDIPIGTKLKMTAFFSAEYELAKFEVFAQIIWRNVDVEKGDVGKGKGGYQYGLKFIQMLEEDHWKLRGLLSGRFK